MRRRIWVILAVVGIAVGLADPALAQSTDRIAVNLNDSGVFVEDGADGTADEFIEVIARLDRVGLDLHIASLADDDPNIEGLARDLRDRAGGTVLVITPGQLAGASDTFSDAEVGRAIDAAIPAFGGDVAAGALSFGENLIGTSASTATTTSAGVGATTPSTTAVPADDASASADVSTESSGSGRGLLIFFIVVVVAIVGLVVFTRRRNRAKVTDELETRRTVVATELEAIGVEIVSLSDPMSVSDDEEATKHFRTANAEFLDLQERLAGASSLWELTEIDHDADTTAWHLDATEALLAELPIPAKPSIPVDPQPPVPTPRTRHQSGGPDSRRRDDHGDTPRSRRGRVESRLDDRRDSRPESEDTSSRQRGRTQRRDSWKPPKVSGGGLGSVLTSVLVGGVLGGSGRSKPPKRWNGAGTVTGTPRPRTPSRRSSGRSNTASKGGGSASRSRRRSAGGSASRRR